MVGRRTRVLSWGIAPGRTMTNNCEASWLVNGSARLPADGGPGRTAAYARYSRDGVRGSHIAGAGAKADGGSRAGGG